MTDINIPPPPIRVRPLSLEQIQALESSLEKLLEQLEANGNDAGARVVRQQLCLAVCERQAAEFRACSPQ